MHAWHGIHTVSVTAAPHLCTLKLPLQPVDLFEQEAMLDITLDHSLLCLTLGFVCVCQSCSRALVCGLQLQVCVAQLRAARWQTAWQVQGVSSEDETNSAPCADGNQSDKVGGQSVSVLVHHAN